jgi:hypothetical protein
MKDERLTAENELLIVKPIKTVSKPAQNRIKTLSKLDQNYPTIVP